MAPRRDISTVKALSESNPDALIPSYNPKHANSEGRDDIADELASLIPVIDFSILTSGDPQIHAAAVRQLVQACQNWGFFMVTNHGVSENLLEDIVKKCIEFHNLHLEEKKEFSGGELLPSMEYAISAPARDEGENVHYCIGRGCLV